MNRRQFVLCVWALTCVSGWISGTLGDNGTALEPGTLFEQELRTHQEQIYTFEAVAEDLLHLRATQKGIDITLEIRSEGEAELLLAVDSRNRGDGPEELWWIPWQSGTYSLTVRPLGDSVPGHYNLELSLPKIADRLDTFRAQAISKLALARQETPPDAHFDVAIKLWQAAGEDYQEGLAWFAWADVARKRGDFRDAIEKYGKALGIFQRLGEVKLEIDVLAVKGQAHRLWGDQPAALEAQSRALHLSREIGAPLREAEALNNLGVLYQRRGELRQALDAYSAALEVYDRLQRRRERASVLVGLGQIYSLLGRHDDAMEFLGQAYRLARSIERLKLVGLSLSEMGSLHAQAGRYLEAAEHYNDALEIQRRRKDAVAEAGVLHLMGKLAQEQGDLTKARQRYRRALILARQAQVSQDQGHLLLRLAELDLAEGANAKAVAGILEALTRMQAVQDFDGALYGRYLLGRALEDPEMAHRELESAFEMVERQRRRLANQTLSLSFYDLRRQSEEAYRESLLRLGRDRSETRYFEQAFRVGERVRARGLVEMLAARAEQPLPEAMQEIGRRINVLEWAQWKQKWASQEAVSGSASSRQITAELKAALLELDDQRAAFLDATGVASLEEVEIQGPEEIRQGLLDPATLMLVFTLGEEQGELWAISPQGWKPYALPGRREIIEQVDRLPTWLFKGFKREKEAAAQRVLRRLSDLLLERVAEPLADVERLVIVSDGELHSVPFAALPAPGRPGLLIEHYELVRLPSASVLAWLRERAAGRAPADRSLAVLADPVFSADDVRFVEASAMADSLTGETGVEEVSRRALEFERAREAVGLATLPRLAWTGYEAKKIVELWEHLEGRPAKTFDGNLLEAHSFAAHRELATSGRLADFQILHFATHAFVNRRHPELSGLVFSLYDEEGRQRDGFLRSHEIARLNLNAELVVLSACETAVGNLHAEGPSSLARSFLNAGATRVVVSFWQVDDQATAKLMGHFYRAMWEEGKAPAAALRAAQLALRAQEKYRAPYYWAGFELQGDWRAP